MSVSLLSSESSTVSCVPQQQVLPVPLPCVSLAGLSDKLLHSHHQNNYGGAVKRLNAIRQALQSVPRSTMPWFELNGLKREELIATNSMLLHELYFDSLGNGQQPMAPAMQLALAGSFGSEALWRDEFSAIGKALGGGSGWALLTFQPREGTLVNQWAADHTHAVAGGVPILALDMYEHAYHMDYGAASGAYVDAFMANIDWAKVYQRYQHAVHAASEALAIENSSPQALQQRLVLDVRRQAVFEQSEHLLPGAIWRDPAKVVQWAAELPANSDVLVYCVYGHEVCRATALKLRAIGVRASFLPGGIDAGARDGTPLQDKEAV